MNKDCEKYFGLIEDLVEGEHLDEPLAVQAESHIFDCPECRTEYELLQREKEVFGQYLFEFEPPPNSWTNFQARLDEEKVSDSFVSPVESPSRKKRIFVFGFSPVFAAVAILLLFFAIAFILLRNAAFEKNVAGVKSEESQQTPPQLREADPKNSPDVEVKNIADGDDPKSNEPPFKKQSPKSEDNSTSGKKLLIAGTMKLKKEADSSGVKKKYSRETTANDEAQATLLRKQKLETEIAGQFEKIELLLRSFRNAQATEGAASFDVEYEKRQARRLLETNVALRRDAEIYGIAYAEELLSRVDSYLLEIANLGNNPALDKVLDIKERISSQNIIANLQVYSSVAMAR